MDKPWDTGDPTVNWDGYFIPGSRVLRNKLGITTAGALRSAENDLVEARIVELRASPVIVRRGYDVTHLRALHRHLFQDVYEWAGDLRTAGIAKGGESFAPPLNIDQPLQFLSQQIAESDHLRGVREAELPRQTAFLYDYCNYAHPFREGNGRTQREFFDQLMSESHRGLAWDRIDDHRLHSACHAARRENDSSLAPLIEIFVDILTEDPAYDF